MPTQLTNYHNDLKFKNNTTIKAITIPENLSALESKNYDLLSLWKLALQKNKYEKVINKLKQFILQGRDKNPDGELLSCSCS